MQRNHSILATAVLALAVASAAPAGATAIDRHSPEATWQGHTYTAAANVQSSLSGCFDAAGYPRPTPTTTGTSACEVVTLTVDTGGNQGLGAEVTLSGAMAGSDFDLYVYRRLDDGRRGTLVDSSTNSGADEVAFIENGAGDYYVVTIAYTVVSSSYAATARLTDSMVRNGRPVASYLHDVSPKDPAITISNSIVEQHRVLTDDGIEIDTWVVRPPLAEPVPVVLQVTPYYGGGSPVKAGVLHHLGSLGNELVPRGYAFAIVSVRGTGNSQGCFTIGGPSEARDTARVIEHYAAQPWASGNVGLIGASYDGTTAQDVWVEAPPALRTIVPVSGISDLYKYNFVNGVHIDPQGYAFNAYYWLLVGVSPAGLYLGTSGLLDPTQVPGAVLGEACVDQAEVQEGGLSSALDGNKDVYWQRRDFLAELAAAPDRPRASVFYIHGLQDWNVKPHNMEDWLAAVQATGVPFKAWLGQWAHAYPNRADWFVVLAAWFDQFLKGRDTGILDAPRVQLQTDAGAWRHEAGFLVRSAKTVTLHPRADGTLGSTAGSGTAHYYDYNGNLVGAGGELTFGPDRVELVSAPLERDLLLSGMPRFEGIVTASGARASLVLTLAIEAADGTRRSINYAAQSLNHAETLASGDPDVAGEPKPVAVDFFPQDDIVRAGERLVLVAAGDVVLNGSPGPELAPLSSGSTMTLDLASARLVLPVDGSVTYEP